MIEIKELEKEECKLKRIHKRIKNNAKLNGIEVSRSVYHNSQNIEIWDYDFDVMKKSWFGRHLSLVPITVGFWGKLNTETCIMTIGMVEEHLFEHIYAASKLLFSDIEELTVIIEKNYC